METVAHALMRRAFGNHGRRQCFVPAEARRDLAQVALFELPRVEIWHRPERRLIAA